MKIEQNFRHCEDDSNDGAGNISRALTMSQKFF